jgi:GH43 family beta-xylosidase
LRRLEVLGILTREESATGDVRQPGRPMMNPTVFANPLLPSPSQDPWVIRHDGAFHALHTDGQRIFLRRSPTLRDVFQRPAALVWQAPRRGPDSRHLWAPELHRLGGRWFIYYAADNGRNHNHRLWVLESATIDPAGPYRSRGMIDTGGWSIDATTFHDDAGRLHLLWSGWEGSEKGAQNLYLAPLRDPLTLAGPRVRLARPTEPWELRGAAVCEGPAVLRRGGMTCIVYSASASWTVHSCLGMLVNTDGDLLNPGSWQKMGPVFQRTPSVWGVGHCSFVCDDDNAGGVILYHAKTRRTRGWRDRNIRAQTFTWGADGLPSFGSPLPLPERSLAPAAPSGLCCRPAAFTVTA